MENKDFTEDSWEIYFELRADVDLILEPEAESSGRYYIYKNPSLLSQGCRRHAIRAIFSFIEAMNFKLRQSLVLDHGSLLNDIQRLLLSDLQVEVNYQGTAKTKPLKASLIPLLKLTSNIYKNILRDLVSISTEDNGFKSIEKSVSVRDRLMHPKNINSIIISDEEIINAVSGFAWMNNATEKILSAKVELLKIEVKEKEHKIKILSR